MIDVMIPPKLWIQLLGEFYLLSDDKPVFELNAGRPQSLLAYLLLHYQVPQSRQRLAFSLWPDSTESQARTNLRNLLFTLRHTLPDADAFLDIGSTTIQWRKDAPFDLDVTRFESALQKAKQTDNEDMILDCLETAVSLYQGDLLPGIYDDWIIPIREELYQQFLEALRQLVKLLEDKGEYNSAARYCQRLLQLDPLDEVAAVQLMRLYSLKGDRAGVRRIYRTLITDLQRELGVDPASATKEVYTQLLHIEMEHLPKTTAVVRREWQPAPLPAPPTPFIGRETELAEIAQRLADPDCRLLTIVGLGGMGKTRLALQTAVGHKPVFSDGVAYVSLATIPSADLIIPTLAESLNFAFAGPAGLASQLYNFLHQKEILIIFDNFEHLLDGAFVLGDILAQTTGVKFLITSQQRLGIMEEWVFEIQGLPLPDELSGEPLEENSAVFLFLQSARRIRHRFALTDMNRESIVRICYLVGGMPLGLELAASWVRSLSCSEIAAEIERSLDFLAISTRNIPERHRSIRAVFDYTWDLLSSEEQRTLKRLSIFHDSFSREEAESKAGVSLTQLLALVDKSLVFRAGNNGYNLHEIIRLLIEPSPGDQMIRSDEPLRNATAGFQDHFLKKEPMKYCPFFDLSDVITARMLSIS